MRQPRLRDHPKSIVDKYRSVNAVAETFFATIKKELVYRRTWPTRRELEAEVFEYIEAFYNLKRRHSTLGMLSPAAYEAAAAGNAAARY